MADTKLTGLDAVATLDDADIMYVVTDVATTPASKKITVANIKAEIDTGITAEEAIAYSIVLS